MEIERYLFSEMRPKSKWDRVVLTEIIIEAGLTLIAEGETAKKVTKLNRARMVRNGLMQAFLAAHPMRRKNFASLEIGRSIVKQNGTWWILLTAAETKEKRADERPIDDYIDKEIDAPVRLELRRVCSSMIKRATERFTFRGSPAVHGSIPMPMMCKGPLCPKNEVTAFGFSAHVNYRESF